jgi:hypothetical protein
LEKTKKLLRFQRATTERQKIVFPPGSTPNLTLAGEIVRVALLLFHSSCAAHNNTSKRTSTTPPRLPPPHRQERIHGLRRTRTTCVSARSPACPVGRPPRVRTVTTGGLLFSWGRTLSGAREHGICRGDLTHCTNLGRSSTTCTECTTRDRAALEADRAALAAKKAAMVGRTQLRNP